MESSQRRRQWWYEVAAVVCLAVLPFLFSAIRTYGQVDLFVPAWDYLISGFVLSAQGVAPVLLIMWLGEEGFQHFGLNRIKPVHMGYGLIGYVAIFGLELVTLRTLVLIDIPQLEFLPGAPYLPATPSVAVWWLTIALSTAALAFAEELVIRGHLQTRLQQLMRSDFAAVGIASALMASYHVYQGAVGAIAVFAGGFAFGYLRIVTGSIWPGFLAHLLLNLVAHGMSRYAIDVYGI